MEKLRVFCLNVKGKVEQRVRRETETWDKIMKEKPHMVVFLETMISVEENMCMDLLPGYKCIGVKAISKTGKSRKIIL